MDSLFWQDAHKSTAHTLHVMWHEKSQGPEMEGFLLDEKHEDKHGSPRKAQ